jgi:hypothetical protein
MRASPEVAKKLLEQARDGGFCRLCAQYRYPGFVFDAGSTGLTLSLHGKSKSVADDAGKPPPLFRELADSIEAISPMDNLADPRKFTPARSVECEDFLERQDEKQQEQDHAHAEPR